MNKGDVVCVYVYNGILLSHKKEWNNAICSNMDGPRDHHTKWSQTEKNKYPDITHTWNLILKNDANELTYKTETFLQILKTNLWLPKGKRVGEG